MPLSPSRRSNRLATACLGIGVVSVLLWLGLSAWPPTLHRELQGDRIAADGDFGFRLTQRLWPEWYEPASDTPHAAASRLTLHEDGRPLGPAQASHDRVRAAGGGAFSHWCGHLWFSTSDGSDPRTNGRRYEARAPWTPGPTWLYLAAGLGTFGAVLLLVARLRREADPLAWLHRCGGTAFALAGALLLLVAVLLRLAPPTIEQGVWAATPGPIDLFGQPRPWRIPPFFVGVWPDEVRAEHGGEVVTFPLPVVPSPGGFAVAGLVLATGLWLRWPRRRPGPHGPWLALVGFANRALAPAALLLLALAAAGTVAPALRAPLDDPAVQPSFGALDRTRTWPELRDEIARRDGEATGDYVRRLTFAVADGIAHVWDRRHARALRLQVPARENWLLWLQGELDPTQREYFFIDGARMLERGVGMCGHAAHALGELLTDAGVQASLAQLGGHTVVTALVEDREWVLDPDYRVVLPRPLAELAADPSLAEPAYTEALRRFDHSDPERAAARVAALFDASGNQVAADRPALQRPTEQRDIERWAYRLQWPVPLLLLLAWLATERALRRTPHAARLTPS